MSDEFTVHDSSGNIFEDMGMPDADARLARALLARANRQAMRDRAPEDEPAAQSVDHPSQEAEG